MGGLIQLVGFAILGLNGLIIAALVVMYALDGRGTRHRAGGFDAAQQGLECHDWRLWEEQLRPADSR